MIKVKSFTSEMKIFHAKKELAELDKAVSEFIASNNIGKVISVSDTSTTGDKGETIGLIRVLTYEESGPAFRQMHEMRIDASKDI